MVKITYKKMYQYGWFSPNGESVNFGILSKLTFHSLVEKKRAMKLEIPTSRDSSGA